MAQELLAVLQECKAVVEAHHPLTKTDLLKRIDALMAAGHGEVRVKHSFARKLLANQTRRFRRAAAEKARLHLVTEPGHAEQHRTATWMAEGAENEAWNAMCAAQRILYLGEL